MSDETTERPPQPKEGSEHVIRHHNPCGDVILWPAPLELKKGTIVHENSNKTKETWDRYSVDNFIAFIPPPGSKCKYYGFMQFANRSATDTKTGRNNPAYGHPWEPDIKGWKQRKYQTFIDPMELLYDPNLVEEDKAHHALVRRDGPGLDFPPGRPPKNLLLHS